MSSLRTAAEDYLVMRRSLGFKLTTWGRHLCRRHVKTDPCAATEF
jgi:hypothetical protein